MHEVSWPALAWSVVPGLGHIRSRRAAVGGTILGIWLAILLAAAATLGRPVSWMLAFSAISVHSLAFSLLLAPVLQTLPLARRILLGLALYGALLGAIYLPLYRLATHCARVLPVSGLRAGLPIRDGDTLLYTSDWTRPASFRRGDVVAFRIAPTGGHGVVVQAGLGVDRVIGAPGDRVVFTDGVLTVNGQPCDAEHAPLRGLHGIPKLDVTLGQSEYLVLPTSLEWYRHGEVRQGVIDETALRVSRVPESRILGRVFWRANPLTRVGRF